LLDQKERKTQAQPIASAQGQSTWRLGRPALLLRREINCVGVNWSYTAGFVNAVERVKFT